MADFYPLLRSSEQRIVNSISVQSFPCCIKNIVCSLSQLHLSLFSDSTQKVKIYLCASRQNSGFGNRFLGCTERLVAGTSLEAGATALVSCLLCRNSFLPKNLIGYLRIYS